MSAADGSFTLDLPAGDYRLVAEFIGFGRRELTVSHPTDGGIGDLALTAAGVDLSAVEVRAERSSMNLRLDKKVFNVGEDALAQGGSANQVLAQVPAVTVSAEGAVSLRGNPSVTILIDGRPSALADNNGLDGIPASSIERIEVITSPSARYEAAGTAGIINIILKKERQRGYGGSLTVGTGYPADHQALLNLNYRHERFSAFANVGGRYANFRGDGELTRTTRLDGQTIGLRRVPDMDRNDRAWTAFGGIDYKLTGASTLTGSYSVYNVVNDDITVNDYAYRDGAGRPLRDLRQVQDYLEPGVYEQTDLIYSFEKDGSELTVQFNHDAWREVETEAVALEEIAPDPARSLAYRTSTEERSRDFRLQADYLRPLGEYGRLEAGVRLETRIISADYEASVPGFQNVFDYFERIGSAYLQYGYRRDKFGVQAGLRNEFTAIRAENEDVDEPDFSKRYNRLFPSASIKYDLSEVWATQLAYSRRINRPGFGQLNPFAGFRLPTALYAGNPDLDPAYTDRLEANMVGQWEKVTLNPAVYVGRTLGLFQTLIEQRAGNLFGLEDGTILLRPVNLGRETTYGLQVTASYRPSEVVTLNGDVHYRGYRQRGTVEDRNFDFDFATWSASLRAQLKVGKRTDLQTRIAYDARREDVQTINYGTVNGELGVSRRLGDRFTLSGNVRSPRYFRTATFRPTFEQEDFFQWTGWRFGLTLRYTFERGADSAQRRGRGSIR